MVSRWIIVLVEATSATAIVILEPVPQVGECAAVSVVSNLLEVRDEGLRYCSSILSIGIVVDPIDSSTVTAFLTITVSEITLTDTALITAALSKGTMTSKAPTLTTTTTTITG